MLLVLMALMAASVPAAGQESPGIRRVDRPIPDQYVVKLRDVSQAELPGAVERITSGLQARPIFLYTHAFVGFSMRASERAARAVAANPLVDFVEEDGVVGLVDTQQDAPYPLDRIDQRDLPLNDVFEHANQGAGVKAYVLDTGIRFTHNEFGGRAHSGPDFVDGGWADDCHGHGTHVSGSLGGATYGVAKQVAIVAVRVLDCNGSGANSGVIEGIDWVTADHEQEPAVANMSLGGGASLAMDTAIRNSIADGIVYAVAAGNEGNSPLPSDRDACGYSPGRVAEALTIGATGPDDARAGFSNTGSCVDLFAPGLIVRSAFHSGDDATTTLSGTSMSAPHVAGAAAQYLQGHPAASPAEVATALTGNASEGKVGDEGPGSPDLLLYMGFIEAAPDLPPPPIPPPPDVDPGATTLINGEPAQGTAGAIGSDAFYKIEVPEGAARLTVVLDGPDCLDLFGFGACRADFDLSTRHGSRPTDTAYQCRPAEPDSDEMCVHPGPPAGWWFLRVTNELSLLGSYSITATFE